MSHQDLHNKFNDPEYLKNFLPDERNRKEFFNLLDDQMLKKSLCEKFQSDDYIRSFTPDKKNWKNFESKYLNERKIKIRTWYIFILFIILVGIIIWQSLSLFNYKLNRASFRQKEHNGSSVISIDNKEKEITASSDFISSEKKNTNEVSNTYNNNSSKDNNVFTVNENNNKQNTSEKTQLSMKGINSGSDKVYASKSTSDMNKDNLYASELFPGTFKTKKSNTPLNQKNESSIQTNESNSYIMKNESEETGISDNQHKNVMDNFTSFVPFMLPSFIDNDSIRNNNVHIMLPGKSNLTDIPDSSLASPNPFEPVIKKIKHYLYLSAGATWNIRYNKDYHHFSPYGGIAYQYVMPGKPFGFGTELMYFYIINNNMKLFTSKSTQYDFGFKNDSSLFTYKKLHILRFPLKFFRITKMGDIHAGVSMDYILYTRGTLDKYTNYSLYNSSYNSQSANNYITALRPYVFSVMTGYGYSFHKKWKLNADIFYNMNAYGIYDTYVINPIQRGVGIIIRISYNFYRK